MALRDSVFESNKFWTDHKVTVKLKYPILDIVSISDI